MNDIIFHGKTNRVSALFLLYLFFSIFRPPIVSVEATYLMMALNVVIISINIIHVRGLIRVDRAAVELIISFLPFFIYYSILQIFHCIISAGSASIFVDTYIGVIKALSYILLTSVATLMIMDRLNFNLTDYIKHIAIVFAAQLFCVVLAFLIPQVKTFFLSFIYNNLSSDTIISATRRESYFRCYGFADNLFDSLGYIAALAIVIILQYGIEMKKNRIIIFSFILLIIPLLNARTGLLLSAIGMMIVFFLNFEFKKVIKYMGLSIIIIIGAYLLYQRLPVEITRWIEIGINATTGLVHGESSSVYVEILGEDLVWPSSIILGDGTAPELITSYVGIDSGYVQCIWRYGLFGTILLFYSFCRMFYLGKSRIKYILPLFVVFFLYLFKLFGIFNFGSVSIIYIIPLIIYKEGVRNNEKQA